MRGLPWPRFAKYESRFGSALSLVSTKCSARSVSARLLPSGVSMLTRKCGVSAFGNRLKPMRPPTPTITTMQQRLVEAMNRTGDPLQQAITVRILVLLEHAAGEERDDRERDQQRRADGHEHGGRQHANELTRSAADHHQRQE